MDGDDYENGIDGKDRGECDDDNDRDDHSYDGHDDSDCYCTVCYITIFS